MGVWATSLGKNLFVQYLVVQDVFLDLYRSFLLRGSLVHEFFSLPFCSARIFFLGICSTPLPPWSIFKRYTVTYKEKDGWVQFGDGHFLA